MAREVMVLFVMVGADSKTVMRRLQRQSTCHVIFGSNVNRMGYNGKVTRFFYLNCMVNWDTTLEDHGLGDGGRINVVLFGWLFNVADLGYFNQCGGPFSLGRGTYS
jgi:hypothetical protein